MSDSFVTPWPVARQAPLSMGFPRREYWSGLPFSPPGGIPGPGVTAASPALAGRFFTTDPSVPTGTDYLHVNGQNTTAVFLLCGVNIIFN